MGHAEIIGQRGQRAGATDGTIANTPLLIQAGNAYSPLDSIGRHWGDYSFTMVDPVDDETIWSVQGLGYNTGWYQWSDRIVSAKPGL